MIIDRNTESKYNNKVNEMVWNQVLNDHQGMYNYIRLKGHEDYMVNIRKSNIDHVKELTNEKALVETLANEMGR